MRTVSCLLLVAGFAVAQERVIRTFGDSLDSFAANFDRDAVRRDSVKSVAESYAKYLVDQNGSMMFLIGLMRAEHIKQLRTYWHPDLVKKQQDAYKLLRSVKVRCRVVSVKGAVATLERAWRDENGDKFKQTQQLHCIKRGKEWWIERILQQDKDSRFVDRGLGVPGKPAPRRVPRPKPPDQTSPGATVRSFRDGMLRVSGLFRRGADRLSFIYAELLGELMGRDVVAREQAKSVEQQDKFQPRYEIRKTTDVAKSHVRVLVVASEEVVVEPGQRSDIGTAAFDLTQATTTREWYIVGELARPEPKKPPVLKEHGFGLFFFG